MNMRAVKDVMELQENKPDRWAGLTTRITSAMVLAFVAFICLFEGGVLFDSFVLLAVIVMKKEWDTLVSDQQTLPRALGYIYIILPCASLIWLRGIPNEAGFTTTVALIAVISATDIGAYFVGRSFGRHKLSPVISPNKTWEGLAGGVAAAIVVALLLSSSVAVPHSHASVLWLAPLIAVLAQAGDLFESSLKRKAGVKDSGTLLPGHGGLLDRFDGYMFATPLYALFVHLALLSS